MASHLNDGCTWSARARDSAIGCWLPQVLMLIIGFNLTVGGQKLLCPAETRRLSICRLQPFVLGSNAAFDEPAVDYAN